ncbi:MAG: histidine kinase [Candidatus Promineifilaceae bacterium]|nr:histidine kinase [Candidatus Promineifilaceae bacterium]
MSQQPQTRGRQWRGLSLQLFFLVLLPLTLLLLVVAVGGSLLHQEAMRDLVGERDERSARAAAATIGEQLDRRAAALTGLAQRAAQVPDPETMLDEVGPLVPDFSHGIGLFDPNGNLLAASGSEQSWRLLQPDLRAGRADTSYLFLAFSSSSGAGADRTLVVVAVADGFTAAGALTPTDLVRRALSRVFPGGEVGSAFVVTETGELVYHTGSLAPETTPLAHPGVVSALRGESGTTYLADDEGQRVIAFSPITPVGWALVIEEPWQAVADPLLRTTEWAPLVLAPVLIIALLGLGFGARQIIQPLQSLEEKATALAWGDYGAIEEPVGGIAEIQRLQSELIHMARKVRNAQQGLRGYIGAVTVGQEDERRRLARELHDDTIQALIALNQRLQLAQLTQKEASATGQLSEMQQMVSQLIADLRRQIHALRPIYLEDLGLAPALEMLCQEVEDPQRPLRIRFAARGPVRRLSPEVELALYRITQEALSNVVRHAEASKVEVDLTFTADKVTLTVADDGRGFVVPESPAELAPLGHFGLLGIHERAELIGAQLIMNAQAGRGTQIQVEVV